MSRSSPKLPLPRAWPRHARAALLHAIGLARLVLLQIRAVDGARLRAEIRLLEEELRIKDTRLGRIAPPRRPHYDPVQRLAILSLRAARGWNTAETAGRFLVTAATISSWMQRLDEDGPAALVRTVRPVNRFPDFVTELIGSLRRTLPVLGKVRIAQLLARAGLSLAPSTVQRLAKRALPRPLPPSPVPAHAAVNRSITAHRPHHVWHIDLTLLPTVSSWWVPWLPFALPQVWPFCFWFGAILDRYSRSVVAWRLFGREPTAAQVCSLLDAARRKAGSAPRHLISDQGPQFREEYAGWCRRRGVRARYGRVGEHGSIAIIERFFRSLKQEMLRQLPVVPLGFGAMRREVEWYLSWYHGCRPHQGLAGRTPAEVLHALVPARERPRLEPRASWPLARGDPGRIERRVRGKLEPTIAYLGDRSHLPIVSLKQVA